MKRIALEFAGFFVSALLPGVLIWAITRKPRQ